MCHSIGKMSVTREFVDERDFTEVRCGPLLPRAGFQILFRCRVFVVFRVVGAVDGDALACSGTEPRSA